MYQMDQGTFNYGNPPEQWGFSPADLKPFARLTSFLHRLWLGKLAMPAKRIHPPARFAEFHRDQYGTSYFRLGRYFLAVDPVA